MRPKDVVFLALALVLAVGWTVVAVRIWPALVVAPAARPAGPPSPAAQMDVRRLPGRIAYAQTGDIVIVREGRSAPLTSGGGRRHPALTRDGARVAYSLAARVEGRRLFEGQPVHATLAYESVAARSTDGGAEEILADGLVRRDPGGFHAVAFDLQPAWSPDGARLAFVSDDGSGADVFVLTLATKQAARLSQGSVLADPAWSADGRMLAATAYTTGEPGILLLTDDGRLARRLRIDREGEPYRPSFSPDGRWLLVTFRADGRNDLLALALPQRVEDAAIPVRVERVVELTRDGRSWGGVFSPDGDRVAFLREEGGAIDLYVMDVDAALGPGRAQRLTRGGVDGASRPSWSR